MVQAPGVMEMTGEGTLDRYAVIPLGTTTQSIMVHPGRTKLVQSAAQAANVFAFTL